jgi:cellulose synthase/poly-beta-1,6-N-acetylglucosamine synthase-like glycosyltransferase
MLTGCIIGLASILLGLSFWTFLETLNALLFREQTLPHSSSSSAQIAILVPAHNEESRIAETLRALTAQIRSHDQLIVIADNCTDCTATIARSLGTIVLERHDLAHRGKGYALDCGVRFLEAEPPDVVLVIDADCQVEDGTIGRLANAVMATGQPAQATYLMKKPQQSSANHSIRAFAFMVKNLVRPLGLARMGLPCLLTGTGMAFPWAAIRSVNLASGNIVEDMKLGVDLTIAGFAPIYCPEARVIGILPQSSNACQSQRTRWEHGHLQAIMAYVPSLVKIAIGHGRLDALGIALELSVPPLSLFVMGWIAVSAIAMGWGLMSGFWMAGIIAIGAGAFLAATIFGAWLKFGRDDLSLSELVTVPMYVSE